MRFLIFALFIVLAPHNAVADPVHTRIRATDNRQISQVPESAPNPEQDETTAAEERDAAYWQDKSGDASTYEAICERPQTSEHADLCQQWRSAQAASKQVDIAARQLTAIYVEIGALTLTILFSAIAAIAAARAARAASVTVATQINGERARMGVFALRKQTRAVDNGEEARCTIRNFGATPAIVTEYSLDFIRVENIPTTPPYSNISKGIEQVFLSGDEPEKHGPIWLMKDGKASGAGRLRDDADFEFVDCIIFFGYFRYDDVFGKHRVTGFGYAFDAIGGKTRIASAAYNYDRQES